MIACSASRASLGVLACALVACSKSSSPAAPAPLDAGVCVSPEFTGAPLGVHCDALVDSEGRTVLLHGLNARVNGVFDVSFDDGRLPNEPIPAFTSTDAARIRALGFNALRLPINWSAIEPQDLDGGAYDDAYLNAVGQVTALCASAGVYVLLDLHQDAYSKEIGEDGAPLWAIDPAPTELLGGPMGGTLPDGATSPDLGTRRNSVQVNNAFTTLFDLDAGAPLRSRFTRMATYVAARFANDPAVVGFELFNEPVSDDSACQAFYAPMIPAMRAVAPTKLLFFEPSSIRNILDQAPLGSGSIGAGTVYAPHVYTDAFTNPGLTITQALLEPSNVSARAEADSWAAPLVITEYGFGPGSPQFVDYVAWEQQAQDDVVASSFFWLWKEESQGSWGFYDFDDAGTPTERPSVVSAMTRARVEAIAGRIASIAFEPTAKRLEVDFVGDAKVAASNVVSLGAGMTPPAAQWTATCDGQSVATSGVDPLQIPCGGAGNHALVVTAPQ